jgi:hypothetical protein
MVSNCHVLINQEVWDPTFKATPLPKKIAIVQLLRLGVKYDEYIYANVFTVGPDVYYAGGIEGIKISSSQTGTDIKTVVFIRLKKHTDDLNGPLLVQTLSDTGLKIHETYMIDTEPTTLALRRKDIYFNLNDWEGNGPPDAW